MKEDRRIKFAKRYEMYSDNYFDQITAKLGMIYSAFATLKLDVQINDNNNLFKQIINAISNVYSFGVVREFNNDKMKDLYEVLRVDKTMAQANRFMNAFNDILVQVTWNEVNERPELILRLPHQTEVEFENNVVVWVKYFVGKVDEKAKTERWAYWSKDEHYYILKSNGVETIEETDADDDKTNPLGVLPFVYLHNGWRSGSFWDEYTGDDLTGGTIDLGVHLTFFNHIIKSQSFKQLVGKGSNIEGLSGQLSDPLSILTLSGEDTEISVLDLESNYKQLQEAINNLSNGIAINYGISPNQFRMTSQASSGFALQMENLKLDRNTVEQQKDFVVYEKELFELIKIIAKVFGYSAIDNSTMMIDFIEPNYPVDKQKQIELDAQTIELGLTSPQKILMRKNLELSEKDADDIVNSNLEARNNMINKINNTGTLNELAVGIRETD